MTEAPASQSLSAAVPRHAYLTDGTVTNGEGTLSFTATASSSVSAIAVSTDVTLNDGSVAGFANLVVDLTANAGLSGTIFDKLAPMLERLHGDGGERDRAGNRQLHYDKYCMLTLLYLFNPIVTFRKRIFFYRPVGKRLPLLCE